jgi:Domain of unknown function (DUF5605)/Domain of unknown function (DUF5060)/Protein of unknown function (DUF4038)
MSTPSPAIAGYTLEDPVCELLTDPSARAVIERYLPDVGENEWVRTTPGLRLSLLVMFASPLAGAPAQVAALTSELASLHRPEPSDLPEAPWPHALPRGRLDDPPRRDAVVTPATGATAHRTVDIALKGPAAGNPFLDVEVSAHIAAPPASTVGDHTVTGFYDGDGTYRVRFLPDAVGRYTVTTTSNAASLDGVAITVEVGPAAAGDHGPVSVVGFSFRHADGTRCLPLGTTCYAWTHQGDELEETTLQTLAGAPWTKVRMCVFPKSMVYNENEPPRYPFEFTEAEVAAAGAMRDGRRYDLQRPDPDFFRHLERRIVQLADLGVDADLILFHPYDRWGYATMGTEADLHYLRYVVARLASFPNLWWSLANEYDLMTKSDDDWHRLGRLVEELDPYGHPRSIHQGASLFDHAAEWITHASLQKTDNYRTAENTELWRNEWGKAVVLDEIAYEGNLPFGWGNITGEELVRRHWEAACRGGWGGHGETFLDPDDVIWWAKGGVLKGDSPARIAFLKGVLADAPSDLTPSWSGDFVCGAAGDDYLLYYTSFMQPAVADFRLPPGEWTLDVLDTWAMTIEPLRGRFSGTATVELPGRPYIAVRAQRDPS